AHAMGYGACWMTAPVLAAPAIERLLGIDPPWRLVAVVPIGRPLVPPRPSQRLPVSDVLEFR
ncbi:MAG TPA: nitroreductase family protein, partial [Thermoleophilia bacterium]|nr:nitroreductase family protein [Thermoleophilia bacterium]